jgi:hypothetical protein
MFRVVAVGNAAAGLSELQSLFYKFAFKHRENGFCHSIGAYSSIHLPNILASLAKQPNCPTVVLLNPNLLLNGIISVETSGPGSEAS